MAVQLLRLDRIYYYLESDMTDYLLGARFSCEQG